MAIVGERQQFVRATSTSVDQVQDSVEFFEEESVEHIEDMFGECYTEPVGHLEDVLVECTDQDPSVWGDFVQALYYPTGLLSARVGRDMEDENEVLKRKILDLEKEFRKLGEDKESLIIGQLAFAVDQAVMKRVLQDIRGSDRFIFSISDMEKAILGKEYYEDVFTDEEKKLIKRRWNELKAQLGWKGKHYRCVKEWKSPQLQSEIDVDEMQQALSEVPLQPAMKTDCMELLEMLKRL